MKILKCISPLTMETNLADYEQYDLVLFYSWSSDFDQVMEYQQSRKNSIQRIFQLDEDNFKCILFFGKNSIEQITKNLNSLYSVTYVNQKLSAKVYASFIKDFKIPLSRSGYTYFHDLHFHLLGLNYIPSKFSSWWKNYHPSNSVDLVLGASVVEWTTLKGLSPMIEDIFSETKWSQLDLFFSSEDRTLFNSKSISKYYQHQPEIKEIILQWHKIKP